MRSGVANVLQGEGAEPTEEDSGALRTQVFGLNPVTSTRSWSASVRSELLGRSEPKASPVWRRGF